MWRSIRSARSPPFAGGNSGLHLVDVSDPMLPTLLRTVNLGVDHVRISAGVAYVADSSRLSVVDTGTGEILQSVDVSGLTGLAREGRFLYTMQQSNTLRIFQINGLSITARGSLNLENGSGDLFVGNSIAYVTASDYLRGGFSTVDVSDPDQPVLISGSDVVTPGLSASDGLVANGSGLGLLFGQPGGNQAGDFVLDLVDVSDPTQTDVFGDQFISRITLPALAREVSIAGGLGYLALGESGLQIASYLPFDVAASPPTISLAVDAQDFDPITAGSQVLEGTLIAASVQAADDVQVRQVDLLIDGQIVLSDLSFPFDLATFLPSLDEGESSRIIELQTRAIDTGGNTGLSNSVELEIVQDITAPVVESITPADQAEVSAGLTQIRIKFSEALSADSRVASVFRLQDRGGNPFTPVGVLTSEDRTEIALTYALASAGVYTFSFSEAEITDLAGNALGTATRTSTLIVAATSLLSRRA